VKHKERFKQIFKAVDVLTLSATPIPRTLYLTLMGARDMSPIETPPPNRLPVETFVGGYDERLIRSAIERELDRGGQVFFLHNRIHSIHQVRDRLRLLLPKARLEIAHGQMEEHELEEVMMRFVAGEVDVLVATTIIESGLDIPRANMIIIDRADRFGLADLYQLRGRVGRSQMKAYAYLLLPRHLMIEEQARRRVSAIRQYSALGSGFKVAMRDLEIRGAGNVLGTEQSGHASAIGFELYCRLLKESIARLKGQKPAPRAEARVRLDFLPMSEDHAADGVGAFLPRSFMGESRQRIEAYRHLAEASDEEELQRLEADWRDRFGKLPVPVQHLLEVAHLRLAAAARGITRVEVEEGKLMLEKGGHLIMVGGRFPRLTPPDSHRVPANAKRWRTTRHKWLAEIRHLIETLGTPAPKSGPRSP
jgi:transcription-repair coupling factor (superfamily II helicase)